MGNRSERIRRRQGRAPGLLWPLPIVYCPPYWPEAKRDEALAALAKLMRAGAVTK